MDVCSIEPVPEEDNVHIAIKASWLLVAMPLLLLARTSPQ